MGVITSKFTPVIYITVGINEESSFYHIYRDYQSSKMKTRDSRKLDASSLVQVKKLQEKICA